MAKEIWKDIPGYEGLYQASNLGRVKRLDTIVMHRHKNGNIYPHKHKGRILKQCKHLNDHYYVNLHKDGVVKVSDVHVIIAETFIGPHPGGRTQVRHLNCIPTDNRVENLAYGSIEENRRDEYRINRGARQKIPIEEIPVIRKRCELGDTLLSIAKDYGVTESAIWRIKKGYNFGWVQ